MLYTLSMKEMNPDFEYFQSKLPELLKEHKGQYALIKEKTIIGFYNSMGSALEEGYKKFGTANFLIQEITDEKHVNYINSAFIS